MPGSNALLRIKLLHTVAWAFFAACILALPLAAAYNQFHWAGLLAGLVLVECAILAVNRCRCPLTDLAAQHTQDRRPNFDIFLPAWLARWNKVIFGILFLAGGLFALWRWLISL